MRGLVRKYNPLGFEDSVLNVLGRRRGSLLDCVGRIPRLNDCVHLFTGSGPWPHGITPILIQYGLSFQSYDVSIDDRYHDITTPLGQAVAVVLVLSVREGGAVFGGPWASPFMTHRSSRRAENKFVGDETVNTVRISNEISKFLAGLTRLASARSVRWVWEQPIGSSLFRHAPWTSCFVRPAWFV